jgi:pimeloyl-ACP methyl ester carboxylesterase
MSLVETLTDAANSVSKLKLYAYLSDFAYALFCRIPSERERQILFWIRLPILFVILFPIVEHAGVLWLCENINELHPEIQHYCCHAAKYYLAYASTVAAVVGVELLRVLLDALIVLVLSETIWLLSAFYFGAFAGRRSKMLGYYTAVLCFYLIIYSVWAIAAHPSFTVTGHASLALLEIAVLAKQLWPVWTSTALFFVLPIGAVELYGIVVVALADLMYGRVTVAHTEKPPEDTLILFVHGGGFLCGSTKPATSKLHMSYVDIKQFANAILLDYPIRKTPVGVVVILFAALALLAVVACVAFSLVFGHWLGWIVLSGELLLGGWLLILKHTASNIYCDRAGRGVLPDTYASQAAAVTRHLTDALQKIEETDRRRVILLGHSAGATLALDAYTRGVANASSTLLFSRIDSVFLCSGIYRCREHCAAIPEFLELYGRGNQHFAYGPSEELIKYAASMWNNGLARAELLIVNTKGDLRPSILDSKRLYEAVTTKAVASYITMTDIVGHSTALLFTQKFWAHVFSVVAVKKTKTKE